MHFSTLVSRSRYFKKQYRCPPYTSPAVIATIGLYRLETRVYTYIFTNERQMATRVAETCRWLLCNKITFIHSGAPVGLFKKFNKSH
jgi:hypothetical protein